MSIKRDFYCSYKCRHKQKQKLPLKAHKLIPQMVIDVTISQKEEDTKLRYSLNY